MLIYQAEDGTTNAGKAPLGGVISQSSDAASMLNTIANPITYYGNPVINQEGHSGDLYNYYWTSYSRGVDGRHISSVGNEPKWHNVYLDGYIPLRVKSIYDPCPYLYRIPSNGTYNQFGYSTGWTLWSYLAGASWNLDTLGESWFLGVGRRYSESCAFRDTGSFGWYRSSTAVSQLNCYTLGFFASKASYYNNHDGRFTGLTVRCIEAMTC